jgi:ankyrin repeat protein
LHIAARLGHVRIVNVLVEVMKPTSEQLEERDQYEHTAMSLAVLHMHAPVVEALAKAGANMKG